jgi:hypothetical protein
MFFSEIIGKDTGNKYFKKRPLYKNDFVEGYLSRNNRHLRGFMGRLFVLAPNLVNKRDCNPRWRKLLVDNSRDRRFNPWRAKGLYVCIYKRRWNSWLDMRVEVGDKKLKSPFKKGETYDFKLNNKPAKFKTSWAKL